MASLARPMGDTFLRIDSAAFLLTALLTVPLPAAGAAHSRRTAHRIPARVASARALPSHAAASGGAAGPRLCRGAEAKRAPGEPEKVCLELPELRDEAQTRTVTVALSSVPGVRSTIVDLNTRLAVVDYDPGLTGLTQFVAACRSAGFSASEYQVERRFPKPIKLKGG